MTLELTLHLTSLEEDLTLIKDILILMKACSCFNAKS